ncbi:hypothetical protein GF342_05715 [Candidatus Woesearchaeota archaeon]|nr:hypothetical protein [Candidatus Woesearchaeota archaeon]
MVEFNHPYAPPGSRLYQNPSKKASLEKPIFPMSRVGQTIPEFDPAGRHKNIVQVAEAAIRGGAGTLQIVMMVPPGATGRGAHMHGKDVREALRELIKHNQANVIGVELPTSLNNVSGVNTQKNALDEETRKSHLDEIKHAIEFVADAFQGGGTDIVSWEFQRRMFDAEWNKQKQDGKPLFENYPGEDKEAVVQFVDTRNGQIVPVRIREGVYIQRDPSTLEKTDKYEKWTWNDFRKFAEQTNQDPYELFKSEYFQNQAKIARFEASQKRRSLRKDLESPEYKRLKRKEESRLTAGEKEFLQSVEDQKGYIDAEERMAREHEERLLSLEPLSKVAKQKSVQSYKELGLFCMEEESHRKNMKKNLYVGPEIGWPHSYGGHPDEFIELIQDSRKALAQHLQEKGFHGRKYTEEEARKAAHQHIKGCFDTGHVGMWLKHFRPDLPYHKRKEAFTKWYTEQVEKIAKADVVGSVQIVDAHGGEHGHLPPGQGIFPLKESMEIFHKHGFTGPIVSEGHEEEKYHEGRIRSQAWRTLGSPISQSYGAPRFGDIERNYVGGLVSPKMMFGSYTPPFGEYKPWSDIPFE